MTATSLAHTLALGAITGMRSMSGPAALAVGQHNALRQIVPMLALGEMIADKTSAIGDRIDPIPLAGRACMGALVGLAIARQTHAHPVVGGCLGAVTATVAAYLAYGARKRLPVPNLVAGLLEDAVVVGVAAWFAATRRHEVTHQRRSGFTPTVASR